METFQTHAGNHLRRLIAVAYVCTSLRRFTPAGAKDDRRDARVLADALRTVPDCLRELDPLDGSVVELREWSRMSDELTTERTRLTNQVRAQLWRYFPQVLELGFALHSPVIRRVRQASVEKILKKHRIRRIDAAEILQILRAKPVADGAVNAATARIRLILEQLALLEKQIREADQAIDHLLATLNVQQTDPGPDTSETGGFSSTDVPSARSATDRLPLRVQCFVTGRALIPVVQPRLYNQHIRDFDSRWK